MLNWRYHSSLFQCQSRRNAPFYHGVFHMKTTHTHTYYTLVGEATFTPKGTSYRGDRKAGDTVQIAYSTWYGIGGYSEPAWELAPNFIDFPIPFRTKEEALDIYNHYAEGGMSGYCFTDARKIAILEITKTVTTEIDVQEVVSPP